MRRIWDLEHFWVPENGRFGDMHGDCMPLLRKASSVTFGKTLQIFPKYLKYMYQAVSMLPSTLENSGYAIFWSYSKISRFSHFSVASWIMFQFGDIDRQMYTWAVEYTYLIHLWKVVKVLQKVTIEFFCKSGPHLASRPPIGDISEMCHAPGRCLRIKNLISTWGWDGVWHYNVIKAIAKFCKKLQ